MQENLIYSFLKKMAKKGSFVSRVSTKTGTECNALIHFMQTTSVCTIRNHYCLPQYTPTLYFSVFRDHLIYCLDMKCTQKILDSSLHFFKLPLWNGLQAVLKRIPRLMKFLILICCPDFSDYGIFLFPSGTDDRFNSREMPVVFI